MLKIIFDPTLTKQELMKLVKAKKPALSTLQMNWQNSMGTWFFEHEFGIVNLTLLS